MRYTDAIAAGHRETAVAMICDKQVANKEKKISVTSSLILSKKIKSGKRTKHFSIFRFVHADITFFYFQTFFLGAGLFNEKNFFSCLKYLIW